MMGGMKETVCAPALMRLIRERIHRVAEHERVHDEREVPHRLLVVCSRRRAGGCDFQKVRKLGVHDWEWMGVNVHG